MATSTDDQGGNAQAAGSKRATWDEIPKSMLGLKVLATSCTTDDADVDIVAVHGLGATPNYTWKESGAALDWLEDTNMLPHTMRTARIMRFGYDSLWFGKNPINTSLESIADKLVSRLRTLRAGCPDRPIIFIGHCFGGLVIQRALLKANLSGVQEGEDNLVKNCIGCVFLGTPHRGTDIFASQGYLLQTIALASENSNNEIRYHDEVLAALRETNNGLSKVTEDYVNLSNGAGKIKNICFFEERQADLKKLTRAYDTSKGSRMVILVPEASAKLDGAQCLGLSSDHFTMNKFSDPEDGDYHAVRDEIQGLYTAWKKQKNNSTKQGQSATAGGGRWEGGSGGGGGFSQNFSGINASGNAIQTFGNSGSVNINSRYG